MMSRHPDRHRLLTPFVRTSRMKNVTVTCFREAATSQPFTDIFGATGLRRGSARLSPARMREDGGLSGAKRSGHRFENAVDVHHRGLAQIHAVLLKNAQSNGV